MLWYLRKASHLYRNARNWVWWIINWHLTLCSKTCSQFQTLLLKIRWFSIGPQRSTILIRRRNTTMILSWTNTLPIIFPSITSFIILLIHFNRKPMIKTCNKIHWFIIIRCLFKLVPICMIFEIFCFGIVLIWSSWVLPFFIVTLDLDIICLYSIIQLLLNYFLWF